MPVLTHFKFLEGLVLRKKEPPDRECWLVTGARVTSMTTANDFLTWKACKTLGSHCFQRFRASKTTG